MINIQKPNTYLDRDIQSNKHFFFVSYSHKDQTVVYEILNSLYDKGANYWYDAELLPGDQWNEKVKEIIFDYRCIGILWFISEHSFVSDAIFQELNLFQEIKKNNPQFVLIPVSLRGVQLFDYLDYITNKTGEIIKRFDYYNTVMENSTILYILHEGLQKTVESLYKALTMNDALQDHKVNVRGSKINSLKNFYNMGGEFYLNCGTYQDSHESKKNHLKTDSSGFNESVIKWKLIFNNKDIFYFVAEKCLDFVTASSLDNDLQKLEKDLKLVIPAIEKVTLITEEILSLYKDVIGYNVTTDYADYKRLQPLKLFWVDSKDGQRLFYNTNNAKINHNNLNINAGIRPMLILNSSKIREE